MIYEKYSWLLTYIPVEISKKGLLLVTDLFFPMNFLIKKI